MIKNNIENLSKKLFLPVLNYLNYENDQALTLLDQLLKKNKILTISIKLSKNLFKKKIGKIVYYIMKKFQFKKILKFKIKV